MASLDEGYTDEDGVYENKGDNVVDDLREATQHQLGHRGHRGGG